MSLLDYTIFGPHMITMSFKAAEFRPAYFEAFTGRFKPQPFRLAQNRPDRLKFSSVTVGFRPAYFETISGLIPSAQIRPDIKFNGYGLIQACFPGLSKPIHSISISSRPISFHSTPPSINSQKRKEKLQSDVSSRTDVCVCVKTG